MSAGNKLFDLICSLTRAEKRYFRVRSTLHMKGEMNQYMRLFERIERQSRYDEEELLDAFRGSSIGEHFSEAKYYLYHAILRSLHAFHAGESPALRIKTLVHQASILYAKGLHEQCPALIAKARRLAEEHEEWGEMASIARVEFDMLMREAGQADTHRKMNGLFDQLRNDMRLHADWVEQWRRLATLYTYYHAAGPPRSHEELDAYRALAEPDSAMPRTRSARMLHYQSLALYHDLRNDAPKTLGAYIAILGLVTDGTRKPTDDEYWSTLYNVCLCSVSAGRLEIFFEHYPTLIRHVEPLVEGPEYWRYINALVVRAYMFCTLGYFENAAEALRHAECELTRAGAFARSFNRDHIATVGLIAHFGNAEYLRALEYVDELMGMRKQREFIQLLARTISLVAHFELGRFDLLEHMLKSTYKYLRSKERLFAFERLVLDVIRAALNVKNVGDLEELFRAAQARLAALAHDPFERFPLNLLDLLSWVEAKIARRSYADIVREKYRAKHGDPVLLAESMGR